MCGTKCLNPFFKLHEASEVLNKYVMWMRWDNFTAAFFVSFIATVFVPDIEEVHNKVIGFWTETTCSVNVTSTCSANLHDISCRKPSRRAPNLKYPGPWKWKFDSGRRCESNHMWCWLLESDALRFVTGRFVKLGDLNGISQLCTSRWHSTLVQLHQMIARSFAVPLLRKWSFIKCSECFFFCR